MWLIPSLQQAEPRLQLSQYSGRSIFYGFKHKNSGLMKTRVIRDWGVDHISFISILASRTGIERVAREWHEGTDFTLGAVDDELDNGGYVQPGVGDIGDRLYGTELN